MTHHPFAHRFSSPGAGPRIKPLAAAALLLLLASAGCVAARAESANADYKRGERAEAQQNYDAAYADYMKAAQRDPNDLGYRTALDRVRTTVATMHVSRGRKLLASGDLQGALTEFMHAAEIDPGNEAAQQEIARVREIKNGQPSPPEVSTPIPPGELSQLNAMGGPVQLKPISNEPLTLHMNEDSKVIYQAIGKAAGINVLFDPDYTSKRIQVDLSNVNLTDALRIVGAMSNTFWRPITSNTIFVAQDTRVKRTELEEQAVQTFYLTNAWQQNDLNDVQTALRNVLPNAKVYGVASQNAIVMRGSPDELLLAQKLIDDLDKPRSEVVVDFGILEVTKNWERTLGIAWPQQFGVQLQSPQANTAAAANAANANGTNTGISPTLYNLAHLNSNDFAVTVGAATLNLLLNDSQTQILQDPRIRATDGQKATLTIGSKIPIATGSYSAPGISATAAIGYAQTQFQYIDVGVKIEVTPTVHYDDDVTLKVHVETSAETSNVTIEGVTEPIISQRVADQVIRLREGEASILGGIINNSNEMAWTGIPGLSSIPVLKYLFGSKDHTINDDQIVFVVIPHVVRGQELDETNLRAIDTGPGQSIQLRHVSIPMRGAAPLTQSATPVQSNYGVVSAGSASSAAMQAMSQINSNAQSQAMQMPPPVSQPEHPLTPQLPGPNAAPGTAAPPPSASSGAATAASGSLGFAFQAPPGPVPAGATFQVPVQLKGGADIASVPLQFTYDPAKLTLVNVAGGNFLSKDGQAMALIHRDDGPGNVTIVASRPPGTAGASGSGTLCVLTFQAKAAGTSTLTMTRAGAVNSSQQPIAAQAAQANIVVK